mmetsp:Transcript_106710/g.299854  ORF Transcript_106710/g.299854 Transcript_106710/m.299854 type:complete len:290 (+) Transcript_106710:1878-2747(+)
MQHDPAGPPHGRPAPHLQEPSAWGLGEGRDHILPRRRESGVVALGSKLKPQAAAALTVQITLQPRTLHLERASYARRRSGPIVQRHDCGAGHNGVVGLGLAFVLVAKNSGASGINEYASPRGACGTWRKRTLRRNVPEEHPTGARKSERQGRLRQRGRADRCSEVALETLRMPPPAAYPPEEGKPPLPASRELCAPRGWNLHDHFDLTLRVRVLRLLAGAHHRGRKVALLLGLGNRLGRSGCSIGTLATDTAGVLLKGLSSSSHVRALVQLARGGSTVAKELDVGPEVN